MKNILRNFFSVSTAGFLLLLTAFMLGFATFVEHIHGIKAAKALVYNSRILEILLLFLSLATIYSFIRFKLYRKEKITIGLFHLAFVTIIVGAAVTRYFGTESTMHIREGETSNTLTSAEQWFHITATNNGEITNYDQPVLLGIYSRGTVSGSLSVNGEKFRFRSTDYIPDVLPVLQPDAEGEPMIELIFAKEEGMKAKILRHGESYRHEGYTFSFGKEGNIAFSLSNNGLAVQCMDSLQSVDMKDNQATILPPDSLTEARLRVLYKIGEVVFIVKDFQPSAKTDIMSGNGNATGTHSLRLKVSSGEKQKLVTLWENESGIEEPVSFTFGNTQFTAWIGPKMTTLPFSLKLNDFVLEHYPGSQSPSSYESHVQLIDNEQSIDQEAEIYMNHILKHRGYRFYQSSYDNDEKGTILSVNQDIAGTTITYIGYFLLFIGILLSIFHPKSHFAELMRKAAKPLSAILLILFTAQWASGSENQITSEMANRFAKVWVQGHDGRLKPFTTLAYEAVMKMTRAEKFDGLSPEQIVLGMAANPDYWQKKPVIAVSDDKLKEILGITGGKASYNDFFTEKGNYKLSQAVNEAYHKNAALRGTFDNAVIKTDERLNVAYMIFRGDLFTFFPSTDSNNHHWEAPPTTVNIDSTSNMAATPALFGNFLQAIQTDNQPMAIQIIDQIIDYQNKYSSIIPSERKQTLEIWYYRINIVKLLSLLYLLAGFAAIFFFFKALLKGKEVGAKIVQWLTIVLAVTFLIHTTGLGVRGYISGHMPWSNGYESMIYVAWTGILAGLIFARRNIMVIGAAAILSGLTLFVAQMSWLNPEITNLVPVLKSYWLTFHVAIITASYGFVGVCALLGLFNLLMAALSNKNNAMNVQRNIKQLTYISEAAMILGLYFLTIGTFLGAVWANESWGRYWGWDPKETWSLVTILIYAFISHMRLIPGFRGWFAFNLAAILGLLSVLMTYLGVNYYLSGLHSYGSGNGLSFPSLMAGLFSLIGIIAYFAWQKTKSNKLNNQ